WRCGRRTRRRRRTCRPPRTQRHERRGRQAAVADHVPAGRLPTLHGIPPSRAGDGSFQRGLLGRAPRKAEQAGHVRGLDWANLVVHGQIVQRRKLGGRWITTEQTTVESCRLLVDSVRPTRKIGGGEVELFEDDRRALGVLRHALATGGEYDALQ